MDTCYQRGGLAWHYAEVACGYNDGCTGSRRILSILLQLCEIRTAVALVLWYHSPSNFSYLAMRASDPALRPTCYVRFANPSGLEAYGLARSDAITCIPPEVLGIPLTGCPPLLLCVPPGRQA
ncbi:hypothetical protein Q4I30_003619, partial [Leishmania utingensis]